MSVKENKIEGDAIISGDVTTGGGVVANGSSTFKKNVRVEGYLEANNIRGANKGAFSDVEKLKEYYPNPKNGWWALVKISGNETTANFAVYLVGSDGWYDSGKIFNSVSISLDEVDLEGNAVIASLIADIKEVRSDLSKESSNRAAADDNLKTDLLDTIRDNIFTVITKLNKEITDRTTADDNLSKHIARLENSLESLGIKPFDGFVAITSSDIMPDVALQYSEVVFNEETQTFIYKDYDGKYYRMSREDAMYGESSEYGVIPKKGLYSCKDGIYKWDGSNMLAIVEVPTKVSDLDNDSEFITASDIAGITYTDIIAIEGLGPDEDYVISTSMIKSILGSINSKRRVLFEFKNDEPAASGIVYPVISFAKLTGTSYHFVISYIIHGLFVKFDFVYSSSGNGIIRLNNKIVFDMNSSGSDIDTSKFATAEQGAKADTAIQNVGVEFHEWSKNENIYNGRYLNAQRFSDYNGHYVAVNIDAKIVEVDDASLDRDGLVSAYNLKVLLESINNQITNLDKKITAIQSGNTTDGIDSLAEIKAFLAGIKDKETLEDKLIEAGAMDESLVQQIASEVVEEAIKDIDGEITPTYDESSGKLTLS